MSAEEKVAESSGRPGKRRRVDRHQVRVAAFPELLITTKQRPATQLCDTTCEKSVINKDGTQSTTYVPEKDIFKVDAPQGLWVIRQFCTTEEAIEVHRALDGSEADSKGWTGLKPDNRSIKASVSQRNFPEINTKLAAV